MSDAWQILRQYTTARIGQGRVGSALPTKPLLDFQLAHATARDAVHKSWSVEDFAAKLQQIGLNSLCLQTEVSNRTEYLQRPDKGRRLHVDSRQLLLSQSEQTPAEVVIIVSNGLSSTALDEHGLAMLSVLAKAYQTAGFTVGSICLLANARVAVADEIGELLQAQQTVILIGERPGLSAADSLGAYLTYAPRLGNTDAERNCLSNIRPPHGLGYRHAATKLLYLSTEARNRKISGVALKDDMTLEMIEQWLGKYVE